MLQWLTITATVGPLDLPGYASNAFQPYRSILTNSTTWDNMEEIYNEEERKGAVGHLVYINTLNNIRLFGFAREENIYNHLRANIIRDWFYVKA